MRQALYIAPLGLVAAFLLYTWLFVPESPARKVLIRAIEAHGGENNVARSRIGQARGTGSKIGAHRLPFEFHWEETFQMPTRLKRVMWRKSLGITTSTMVFLYRDGALWGRIDEEEPQMDKSKRHVPESFFVVLGLLADLRRENLPLKLLEETTLAGRPVVPIEFEGKGWGHVVLYFDKDTGLLVKRQKRDTEADGNATSLDLFYGQYRDFEGIAVPQSVAMYRDSELDQRLNLTGIKFLDRIDDSVFEKP
jgi:hypothetical protein